MRTFYKTTITILAFTVCGFQSQSLYARQQRENAEHSGLRQFITAQDASVLEERLKKNPDDLTARDRLIMYYFQATITSRSLELEEKREQHIFWLIEHHPDSEFAGSPEAMIQPLGFSRGTDAYQQAKQIWLKQIESHPDNLRIVLNGARFVSLWDPKLGRELLEKALTLDPGNPEASSMLAQSYMQERLMVASEEEKTALAKKAFSIRELALAKTAGDDRFNELEDIATEALEAGETAKAEQYASELLQSAEQFKDSWNYGNAVHKGNIVLGRIALQRGDMPGAKDRLLAAGATPGSPQLDSFGPNMTLAKELLEKDQRDAVLAYLQACAKFWKTDQGRLQQWIAAVKNGDTPDFGPNLIY
jgi:hypothetical protein